MLTVTEAQTLTAETILGKEPSIKTKEAKEFVEGIRKDIEFAEEKGYTIDIPPEWPEVD